MTQSRDKYSFCEYHTALPQLNCNHGCNFLWRELSSTLALGFNYSMHTRQGGVHDWAVKQVWPVGFPGYTPLLFHQNDAQLPRMFIYTLQQFCLPPGVNLPQGKHANCICQWVSYCKDCNQCSTLRSFHAWGSCLTLAVQINLQQLETNRRGWNLLP